MEVRDENETPGHGRVARVQNGAPGALLVANGRRPATPYDG
jgi:hypothetical protein